MSWLSSFEYSNNAFESFGQCFVQILMNWRNQKQTQCKKREFRSKKPNAFGFIL